MRDHWAIFGLGSFGRNHLAQAHELGLARYAIDPRQDAPVAEDVPRLSADLTELVEVSKTPGGIQYACQELPSDHPLREIDVWDVAASTDAHFHLALAALEHDAAVFVEKPPTLSSTELSFLVDRSHDHIFAVDYVEVAHPVTRAVADVLAADGVTPVEEFHWRTKDLRPYLGTHQSDAKPRIMLGDLVHDLSEVDLVREAALDRPLTASSWTLQDASLTQWNELSGPYPFGTDVEARFVLDFEDGHSVEVRGSFARRERRYFVVTNGDDYAAYGNTLTRDHVEPVAAVVEGAANVDELLSTVKTEPVFTSEDQAALLERVDATVLRAEMDRHVPEQKWVDGEPLYFEAPLCRMMENVRDAKSADDLLCPVERTLPYQEIVEAVYDATGTDGPAGV